MAQNTAGISPCCLSGHLHEGTPKGKVQDLYGLPTYVTGTNAEKTIVFIPDIFGIHLPNAQLLADELAETGGFRVVAPDVADGDWVSHDHLKTVAPQKSDPSPGVVAQGKLGAALAPWLVTHREANSKPKIDGFVAKLRADGQVKKVGAIGFCWGGRFAILLGGKDNEPKVDAVVAQHPSFLSVPAEIEAVSVPTQINVGDADAMMSVDDAKKAKSILDARGDGSVVNILPDAVHGFSVRGDQNNDAEKKQKDEATKSAIDFFKKHLA